ncbi:MAG: NAD-dependent epimerase/dehydratase family protein [Thermoplasmata archaeon]
MRTLVTGGAGFIGSHLVDRLIKEGREVVVYDNFSSGKIEFLKDHIGKNKFKIVEADLLELDKLKDVLSEGFDEVFHIAANPDVRIGAENTKIHLEQNIILEAMRLAKVSRLGFTSTSTVYGEAHIIPTPEEYGPLIPISHYGASKLSCEAIISAYCSNFGMKSVIWRFANIVGPRSTHGITYDFINKLKANPKKLTILGDGTQTKSYCYISDCIDAMFHSWKNTIKDEKNKNDTKNVEIYNIGSEDYIDVNSIAKIIVEEMELKDVTFEHTGGVDGGRGWKGDIKVMRLSIDKIKKTGWIPKNNSANSIRLTARSLLGK